MGIASHLRHAVARFRLRRLQHLPIGAAFDEIYKKGIWSQSKDEPSGGGSYGAVAERYVATVRAFIEEHRIRSVLDIGCGDFNIGARVSEGVDIYHAFDVSAEIIRRNQERFSHLRNVRFRCVNACSDALPQADLVTVRQVLQHLTNAQIADILTNIERTKAKHILITEHALDYNQARARRPNLDLPSHSAGTRIALGSSVDLGAPPFLRKTRTLLSYPLDNGIGAERLETVHLNAS